MTPRHLFVYGSLLRSAGDPAHALLADDAALVGSAWIAGILFDTGDYPALVLPRLPGDRVLGELYLPRPGRDAGLLARLDRFEGFLADQPARSLFVRVASPVTLTDGSILPAWVYRYNRPVTHLGRVASGDWAAHRATRTDP